MAAKSISDASRTVPFPPDPKSPASTISTVAREITEAGGTAAPIAVDTRDVSSVEALVAQTLKLYGRIDVLIYNSGAIWWASVEKTPTKRFQLMQRVNIEGLYATIQAMMPVWADQQWKGKVVVVCPPIYSRFFRGKTAYAMGKVGMSVLVKGLGMDWVREGKTDMAITGIWPAVSIESAATEQFTKTDPDNAKDLRKTEIFSDTILAMLAAPTGEVNGLLAIDEDYLRTKGVTDFEKYSVVPGATPRRIMPAQFPDLTVAEQDDEGKRTDSTKLRETKAKL